MLKSTLLSMPKTSQNDYWIAREWRQKDNDSEHDCEHSKLITAFRRQERIHHVREGLDCRENNWYEQI